MFALHNTISEILANFQTLHVLLRDVIERTASVLIVGHVARDLNLFSLYEQDFPTFVPNFSLIIRN